MTRPMRAVTRRSLLARTRASTEREAATVIHALLKRRYSAVGRDLRRANLRKRLQKVDGDTRVLFKDDEGGNDWDTWIETFTDGLIIALTPIVVGIDDVEVKFWETRNIRPNHVDPQGVIDAYQARTGRQIKGIGETTRDEVLQAIQDWYATDAGLPELIDDLGQWFGESRAEMIARTESTFIASQVSLDIYGQVGVEYWNSDLASDPGPCPTGICESMATTNPHGVGEEMPPYHPNCVLPGNEVLIPDLVAASKSFYVGRCIEIHLASGRNLTVTQNHPILTARGWVKAKLLRELDYAIVATDGQRTVERVNPNNQNRPTRIEEIFSAAKMRSAMLPVTMPPAAEDFHGDGRDMYGDVEIVNVNSLLWHNVKPQSSKAVSQLALNRADVIGPSLLSDGVFNLRFDRALHALNGVVRGGGQSKPFFGGHTSQPESVGFGLSSPLNAMFSQETLDNFAVNSPLTSEFLLSFAADVTGDQIVGIRNFDFSGHVYDLQSSQYELYICNTIITHNCQCGSVPANADGSVFI